MGAWPPRFSAPSMGDGKRILPGIGRRAGWVAGRGSALQAVIDGQAQIMRRDRGDGDGPAQRIGAAQRIEQPRGGLLQIARFRQRERAGTAKADMGLALHRGGSIQPQACPRGVMTGQLATQVAKDPRIHLTGYGPSASTIGANRAGRAAARELIEFLTL